MTTPKEIQAALDGMPNLYGDVTQRPQPQLARWYDRHFKTIRHVLQSHAQEARPVDADQLKREVFDNTDLSVSGIVDYLLIRGFRRETKKKDDPLSMGFISVDHDGTKRLDVAGYLSTPEGQKRLAEIMGKGMFRRR